MCVYLIYLFENREKKNEWKTKQQDWVNVTMTQTLRYCSTVITHVFFVVIYLKLSDEFVFVVCACVRWAHFDGKWYFICVLFFFSFFFSGCCYFPIIQSFIIHFFVLLLSLSSHGNNVSVKFKLFLRWNWTINFLSKVLR